MTPSKEKLEADAKHFANTVFAIGAGVLIFGASQMQPIASNWVGSDMGGHAVFIVATVCIFLLASNRTRFALFAIERQCKKYGHVAGVEPSVCARCFQVISRSAN